VGCTVEDDRRVLAVVRPRRNLAASLGVHPHEASTWTADTEGELEALLRNEAVRFVGEAGLDWHYDLSPRETQETVFRAQIRLAIRVHKPLMIHTREAPDLTLRILEEEGAGTVGGIIHCFSEDQAFARQALDLGFHLSFSGIVTFKNAQGIRDVAAWAPLDRILVETDSPYLAPVPHRGKPNEPAFVTLVAAQVAALRGMPPERLGEIATRNLEALCGWSPSF
jgi:TatD DNase family protein